MHPTSKPTKRDGTEFGDATAIAELMIGCERCIVLPVHGAPLPDLVTALVGLAMRWAKADVAAEEKQAAALLLLNVAATYFGRPPAIATCEPEPGTDELPALVLLPDIGAVAGTGSIN